MRLIFYFLFLAISGCASSWSHETASDIEIKNAYADCVKEGRDKLLITKNIDVNKPQDPGESIVIYKYAFDCMRKQGFKFR
jgi:hypothetical protein